MRVSISSHRTTGSIELIFGLPNGFAQHHVILDGVHIWLNSHLAVEQVLLSEDDDGFESIGLLVLGSRFNEVIERVQSDLIDNDESLFNIEIEEVDLIGHRQIVARASQQLPNPKLLAAPSLFSVDFSLKAGDGTPIEVVVEGTPEGLRTAVVQLPDVSGVERVANSSTAHVVWNPQSYELKVRLAGIQSGEGRLWVRVALGESGDLLAVDRARVQPDGSAVSSSIVPHTGAVGELYVDVTDAPTEVIGTSRFRMRRRAARLEAFAVDLERQGQKSQAEMVRDKAHSLRRALGEEPIKSDADKEKLGKRYWWLGMMVLMLVGVTAGWFIRGSDSSAQISNVLSESSLATSTVSPTVIAPQSSSLNHPSIVPEVVPSDQSLIVYRDSSTRFYGEGNANLAAIAEKVDGATATIRVQLYDQYERALGESTTDTEKSLLRSCEERIGSDTGSGGGNYALTTHVGAFVASSAEDAQAMLSSQEIGKPAAEFVGSVTMTANIIENCELRLSAGGSSIVEVARSAFETFTLEVPLNNQQETYVVLRIFNDKGSMNTWTSNEVLRIG